MDHVPFTTWSTYNGMLFFSDEVRAVRSLFTAHLIIIARCHVTVVEKHWVKQPHCPVWSQQGSNGSSAGIKLLEVQFV